MLLDPDHRALLTTSLDLGDPHGLALAGGHALQAHDLVYRESRDLDFATGSSRSLEEIAEAMAAGYRRHGYPARIVESSARLARLVVGAIDVALLKEALQEAPVRMTLGPVLSLADAVGLKVRALHDRGQARDFIDVHGANAVYPAAVLERLGAVHDPDFGLDDLCDRLGGLSFIDDAKFRVYGLAQVEIDDIRTWAHTWHQDLTDRLAEHSWLSEPPTG